MLAASRDFPYPLDAQTAAAVGAAIAHQVESWSVLNDGDTIDEWVYQELGEQAPDGDLDESAARISRRVERALRRLVRTEQVKPHVVQTGKRIAKEIIRDARFDSFIYVLDKDAAAKIIDEELDEFLS